MDRIIQHIYEDNVLGKLSDSRYLKLSRQYEKEQAEIEQLAAVLEREIEAQAGQVSDVNEFLKLVDSPANCLCLCTGSLGCAASNDVVAMVRKYSAMGRIAFMHIRNVKILEDGSFEERAHLSSCGSLDVYEIVRALVETGFDGYVRPDHGRMIWGETGKPGYGLYDRALGAAYINGLFEACEKALKA